MARHGLLAINLTKKYVKVNKNKVQSKIWSSIQKDPQAKLLEKYQHDVKFGKQFSNGSILGSDGSKSMSCLLESSVKLAHIAKRSRNEFDNLSYHTAKFAIGK